MVSKLNTIHSKTPFPFNISIFHNSLLSCLSLYSPGVPVRWLQLPGESVCVQYEVVEQGCSRAVGFHWVAEALQHYIRYSM